MKSFETELKKYAEKTRLKVSERREIRERLLSYMEYHPLPKQESIRADEMLFSESFITFKLGSTFYKSVAGVFALVMVIIPVLAERAVPGDVLYLVKTGINESVQSQLANSPYEKIEFETRLMERRIAEARTLASEGRLTDEAKVKIAETVKEHGAAVQSGLAELREQDADSAAIAQIAYSSSLEVQSAVLGEGRNGGDVSHMATARGGDAPVDPIVSALNDARDVTEKERGTTTPSFNGLIARVETQTTRAYELFNSIKGSATPEEIIDIERRLSDVNRLIEEAKTRQSNDELIAVEELAQTLKQIQKLIFFMTDINVRQTVALETLVPVVLSTQERIDLAKEEVRVINGIRQEVLQQLDSVDQEGIVTKVTEGLSVVDSLVLKATTGIDLNDTDGASVALSEAHTLVADLYALVMPHVETEIDEEGGVVPEETVISEEETGTSTPIE